MKKSIVSIFTFSFILIASMFAFIAVSYAQVATQPMETLDFIQYVIQQFGSIKGASTWVVAGIIVQVLIKFMDSKLFGFFFSKMKGSVKLVIVLALTYIAGVIGMVTVGDMSVGQAFLQSTNLSALLVLLNQIYKQFFVKKD